MQTIKHTDTSEVSIYPEHGGIITSLKLNGREVLYLDEETLHNTEISTRGGIPILFPNAGSIKNSFFPDLKPHGFARNSANWEFFEKPSGFMEMLVSNTETMSVYPYKFKLSIDARFIEDNCFEIIQKVENLEIHKTLPVVMGLHPYFKVPHYKKDEIIFNFEGGQYIKENHEIWQNGGTVFVDNPKLKDADAVMEIYIPDLGTLVLEPSIRYKKIWVWSMPQKDFICIEPVTGEETDFALDPVKILPNEFFTASITFKLKG